MTTRAAVAASVLLCVALAPGLLSPAIAATPATAVSADSDQTYGPELVAWNSALLYDLIYTQPVYYELGQLAIRAPDLFHAALLQGLRTPAGASPAQ